MIELSENSEVTPRCPHCKTDLPKIWYQELRGLIGKRYIYFCSVCLGVLGVSHRKGLLLG